MEQTSQLKQDCLTSIPTHIHCFNYSSMNRFCAFANMLTNKQPINTYFVTIILINNFLYFKICFHIFCSSDYSSVIETHNIF